MNKFAIILAAGKGSRMKSKLDDKSKVSYEILGVPLIRYVIDALKPLKIDKMVAVLGFGAQTALPIVQEDCQIAYQLEQKGTGHAIMQVMPILSKEKGSTIIVCGDTPLLKTTTLEKLFNEHLTNNNKLTLLGARIVNPYGYGRLIIDDKKQLLKIVEEKNASEEEKKVNIVNTGVYIFDNETLFSYLDKLIPNPLTKEYYLTDLIEMFALDRLKIGVNIIEGDLEMKGINDRYQLYEAMKIKQEEINKEHMLNGVTIVDASNTYIGPYVQIGADTIIEPNTYIYGNTIIGERNHIGPNTYLNNMCIGNDNEIIFSHLVDSTICNNVHIGPYARLRGHALVKDNSKIGNFVELKNAQFDEGVKSAHLSYLGDVHLGKRTNVGCGVIFANYDGVNKFHSEVGEDVFLGSNSTIISPVNIKKEAFVAAGSTINKDVEELDMAIARARQENKSKYAAKLKQKALNIKKESQK